MKKGEGGIRLRKAVTSVNIEVWGTVDEKVSFKRSQAELKELLAPGDSISIDLGEIYRMNSVGIRAWIEFIGEVEAWAPVEFSCLGEVIILQAANIPAVLGKKGAAVRDFVAPYHCGSCKTTESRRLPASAVRMADGSLRAPELQCSRCGKRLELDALEEVYLSFLRRAPAAGDATTPARTSPR